MASPGEVGAALRLIQERTGMSWREVAELVGTTPEYARKLASGVGKFGRPGAGASLSANVRAVQTTGETQAPIQRPQRVRQPGGRPSAPAAPRVRPEGVNVRRSIYSGATRDGWAVSVDTPAGTNVRRSLARGGGGDREDARALITDAVRRAAQGRRRVMFHVTYRDPNTGQLRTAPVGERTGYDARRALRGINDEGRDPLAWLVAQGLDRYTHETVVEPEAIESVEVVALD